jgi:hypothetical protein
MSYEHTGLSEAPDDQIIAETIGDLQTYLQVETEQRDREAFWEAGEYIDSLYDKYAPEISQGDRMLAKILGGLGLARAEMRYGKDEFSPRFYGGRYEDKVIATYHHAGHPRSFIENSFKYAVKVNEVEPGTYDTGAFIRLPIIGAFHDNVMGNGRGNDERQSAALAAEMMQRLGFTLMPDEPTYAAIEATTWSDELKRQSVDDTKPFLPYQRVAAVSDLLPMFDRRGPYQGLCVLPEDMSKRMHGQILTKEAALAKVSLIGASVDDCMDLIDRSEVLSERYGELLHGQGDFFENFKPGDPRLDEFFPGREENVHLLREISSAYHAGSLTARETLEVTRDFMNAA